MKLISLNIWGGQVHKPLLDFIDSNRNIDIFCFQEVYHEATHKICDDDSPVNLNIFSELQSLLPEHMALFSPVVSGIYGVGMFVKQELDVVREGTVTIYENPHYKGSGPTHSRTLQWVECRHNHRSHTIANVHGLWNGKGKTDSPERLAQSERIRGFLDAIQTPKILCGDFNLRPETESIKILEKGMTNWVTLRNIPSTRTSLYTKDERHADYIFTSPEIAVHRFEVWPHEVSDHAPLFLEFA